MDEILQGTLCVLCYLDDPMGTNDDSHLAEVLTRLELEGVRLICYRISPNGS